MAPHCALCIIAKNEQSTLPRCLESVAGLADEVILVDTGSTDRTTLSNATFKESRHEHQPHGDCPGRRRTRGGRRL
jgi:glycosyltransferase involved in cell wall biosynthesis